MRFIVLARPVLGIRNNRNYDYQAFSRKMKKITHKLAFFAIDNTDNVLTLNFDNRSIHSFI